MPFFNISKNKKNKLNPSRRIYHFLVIFEISRNWSFSPKGLKNSWQHFKFIRKTTKPTESSYFWLKSVFQNICWSFYSLIHNFKLLLYFVYSTKNTCFSLFVLGRRFFRPEACLFYFFIQILFPRFFSKNFSQSLAIETFDLVSHLKKSIKQLC